MEKRICKCCGAPLKERGWDGWICEYCGTKYSLDTNGTYIKVVSPGCHTLMAQAEIDDYWVMRDKELASQMVMDKLTMSLADTLKEYMTLQENIDPLTTKRIYRGMIRVVPEGFRYE